jgi:hypothetical protein
LLKNWEKISKNSFAHTWNDKNVAENDKTGDDTNIRRYGAKTEKM